jgi:hypothetical protein
MLFGVLMMFLPAHAQVVEVDGVIQENEYEQVLTLGGGTYTLAWETVGEDVIYFGMSAQTDGWVALGFDPVVVIDNADILYGWVDEDGAVSVVDTISIGAYGPTPLDTERGGTSDILDYAGSQVEGWTTIEFSRYLRTGDEMDSSIDADGGNKLVWMYGGTDDFRSRYTEFGYAYLQRTPFAAEAPGGPGAAITRILLAFAGVVLLSWGILSPKRMRERPWWPAAYTVVGFVGAGAGIASAGITLYVNSLLAEALPFNLYVTASVLVLLALLVTVVARTGARPGSGEPDGWQYVHSVAVPVSLLLLLIHLFLCLIQSGLIG